VQKGHKNVAFCTLECQAKVAAKLLILFGVPDGI
jgi:hypothetical protein